MDSDFLKVALNAIIGLVDGVTTLIDTFGTLPTLIGAFAAFESFQGVGLFKTVKDGATGAATGITNAFSDAARQTNEILGTIGLKTESSFKASIDDDIAALNRYKDAVSDFSRLGLEVDANTFDNIFKNASESARKFAQDGKLATDGLDGFVQKQKEAQVATLAQNKSLGNARAIIKEYYSGCKNVEMSQESFANAVSKTNPKLAEQLKTAKNANGAFSGYIKSLVGAKVATFALETATLAFNAAITMCASFIISGIISAITKWINADKELAESVDELTTKFKEQHEELQKLKGDYDTTNESSLISKYKKLSKGVDNLGRNVSLTADEYSEYQSIVETIASQIPSLVYGYDEQGNALLSCKDNVELLTAAYEELIQKQNDAVLNNYEDIEKDFKNAKSEASSKYDGLFGTKISTDAAEYYKDILEGKEELSNLGTYTREVGSRNVDYYRDIDSRDIAALADELEANGLERNKTGFLGTKESDTEFVRRAFKKNKDVVLRIVNDFYSDLEAETEGMKSAAEATLSNAFDISSSDYYGMSDTLKNVARQIVNGFDYEFFNGLEDGTTVEDYVNNMLDQLNSISDVSNNKIEAAFDLQTQFNGGEISYGEYVKGLEDTGKLIDNLSIDKELKTQLKLSIGLNEAGVVDEYQKLVNKLSDHTNYDFDSRITSDVARAFLDSLSAEELSVAVGIIAEMSDNDITESIQDIRDAINRQMAVEGLVFDLNFEVETASIDAFNTALSESVTASGLSSESISALKGRYAELENQGYDLSAMFEETSNGIHLNRKAVGELERAYAKQKQADITEDLQSLQTEYDLLTQDINNCNDASERASLYVQRDAIAQQINDAATLATQYQGLTSAYNDWLAAEEAGQERDMYENIIEGFENIDDEISRGWMDDGTIEFLELLTGKDLSTSSIDDLKAAYKGLSEEIGNSGYSIRDFFTVNEDGDSTNAGVYNFLETIESFDKLKGAIQRDKETGEIEAFNFSVVGGDQAIAEALGISEELVQIMLRAADDAGFVITLDGAYTQLADLKIAAESANDSLKKLYSTSGGKLGTEYTFDFNVSNIDDATTELDKALEVLDQYKKNGVIDLTMDGAEDALKVAETLQILKNKLEQPVYMSVNTSELQEELQEPVELLQEYEKLTQERDLLNLSGEDKERLSEIDTELDNIATNLYNLPDDTKLKLGIDDLSVDQIKEELENGTIEIPTELTIEANMDKSLEDLVTLGLLEQGLITEEEARIKLGLEIEKVDTSKIKEALEEAEISEEQQVKILAIAEVLGVENVDDLSEKLDSLTDEQIQVLAEVLGKVDVEELKLSIENLDDKTIEAIAKAIGEGDIEGLKTALLNIPDETTANAIAKAFGYEDVNELCGAIDNLDTKVVQAIAQALGITDVDSLKTAIDRLTDKNVDAAANVSGESEVDSLRDSISGLTGKTVDVVVNFIKSGWETVKGWFGGGKDGGSDVNGTAHAYGTVSKYGKAFKQGDWRTKKSETALVGELGREIVVTPNNKWHTVGDNGAEFTRIPRGSIVFNHKQTEELLNNGKVTSNGGRAKALASGTAFSSGSGGGFGKYIEKVAVDDAKSGSGKSKKKSTKSSSGSTGSDGGSGRSDNSNSSSSSSSSSSKAKDDFEETIDWIETKISRIERVIDQLDQKASNVYKTWSERNKALAGEISEVHDEIELQQQAYNRYMQEANSIGLSASYVEKIQNGTIDIETITDEALKEKIDDYQKYYEAALDAEQAIEELKEQEASLYQQRFENASARYEGILGTIEHEKNMLEEYINQAEAQGWLVSYEYYRELSSNEKRNIAELEKQRTDMLAELETAMESGTIEKGSEAWYEMVGAIDEVTLSIEEANTRVMEISQTAQQLKWEQFDILQDKISAVTEEADFLIELLSSDKLFDDNGNLTDEGKATMGLHGQNYNTYMHQADQAAAEVERLKKQIEEDPYDMELQERYQEMISLQQEYILAAEQEKEAIRDLVEEGIQLEIEALEDRIDKYNEALESQKD